MEDETHHSLTVLIVKTERPNPKVLDSHRRRAAHRRHCVRAPREADEQRATCSAELALLRPAFLASIDLAAAGSPTLDGRRTIRPFEIGC